VSARKAIVPTLVLASLAAAAFFAFARSGPRAAALRQESSSDPASEASPAPGDQDEVRRLRAELKAKDGVIRAITKQAIASDADRAAAAEATIAALKRSQFSRAIETLDARIAAAPADAAGKAELEQAMRPAFESAGFGDTRVVDVRCGGELCKVAVSANSGAELIPALEAMSHHVPKSFPAVITLPGEDEGERAVFLGRTSAAIALPPPP
jgi:hypothetical protein